ncbi:MAG: helix-turn-helix domain-containing protein, partial [Firmicutes bacterium]|nr:helix-turn-helix domain-containing protein [Bacillota bacterium]
MIILLDRSLPKSVAQALKAVRDDVRWLEDVEGLTPCSPDEEWLKLAGERDWMVITTYRCWWYSITMLKAYRYCLYPTEAQAAFLTRQFGCVRYVYNWGLALATQSYQTQGQGLTRFQLDKRLTALKQELPWLREVAAQPLQQALIHLDKAFTRFFREKRGYPRFKTKRGPQSAVYPQGVRVDWDHSLLYVPKAGWVRAVFSRRFTGRI